MCCIGLRLSLSLSLSVLILIDLHFLRLESIILWIQLTPIECDGDIPQREMETIDLMRVVQDGGVGRGGMCVGVGVRRVGMRGDGMREM